MRKRYPKVILFAIILGLIMSVIGCNSASQTDKEGETVRKGSGKDGEVKESTDDEGNEDEDELLNPVGTFPIAKEKTELSILMPQDTLVEDYETNALTKWIEENCNVDLKFELLPATDAGDKLAVMISSNQELPDIVNMALDMTTTYKYGSGGAFIPLNDFYENESYYIKQQIEKYPDFDIIKFTQAPDGNLYSIPQYYLSIHSEVPHKYWINTTWLDKIAREMPATTDEFYEVLKDFKEKDPNGNGKVDEYPLVGGTGGSQDPTVFLMNSFIYDDDDNRFLVEDGQLSVAYTTDAWREGLRYMRKLCSEDLLSPLSFTQDDSQLRAMVDNPDDCIVGCFAFTSITLLPVNTSQYINDFAGLPPLKGPEGVCFTSYQPTLFTNRWFITRDCKNPELAFRVGDFLFNEDAFMRGRYGVEGEDWSAAQPDEVAKYDGYKAMFHQDVNIWTLSQNKHWRNNIPAFTVEACQGEVQDDDPLHYSRLIGQIVPEYQKCKPEPGTFVPVLYFEEDEINEISEIQANLKTYVDECKIRFVTGDMDIDKDWDSYLAEIDRIGLDHFLQVCQKAYDRMYK